MTWTRSIKGTVGDTRRLLSDLPAEIAKNDAEQNPGNTAWAASHQRTARAAVAGMTAMLTDRKDTDIVDGSVGGSGNPDDFNVRVIVRAATPAEIDAQKAGALEAERAKHAADAEADAIAVAAREKAEKDAADAAEAVKAAEAGTPAADAGA